MLKNIAGDSIFFGVVAVLFAAAVLVSYAREPIEAAAFARCISDQVAKGVNYVLSAGDSPAPGKCTPDDLPRYEIVAQLGRGETVIIHKSYGALSMRRAPRADWKLPVIGEFPPLPMPPGVTASALMHMYAATLTNGDHYEIAAGSDEDAYYGALRLLELAKKYRSADWTQPIVAPAPSGGMVGIIAR